MGAANTRWRFWIESFWRRRAESPSLHRSIPPSTPHRHARALVAADECVEDDNGAGEQLAITLVASKLLWHIRRSHSW